jgi:hypothetical protein
MGTRTKIGMLAAGALGPLLALTGTASAATWQVHYAPDQTYLRQVAPVADSDIWFLAATSSGAQEVLRLSGSAYSTSALPSQIDGHAAASSALAVDTPADAWVVGNMTVPGYNRKQPLIQHYDGHAWTPTILADDGTDKRLSSVVAPGPANAWASGGDILVRWDGSSWTRQPLPPAPAGSSGSVSIGALTATGPGDVWGIGTVGHVPYAAHWNGTSWSATPAGPAAASGHWWNLTSIAADGTNVWIAGTDSSDLDTTSLLLRWNGSAWSNVSLPKVGVNQSLVGIAAAGPNNVWATGTYQASANDNAYRQLLFHWNGTSWSAQPSPISGAYESLAGSAVVPGSPHLWAIGGDNDGRSFAVSTTD